MRYEHISKSNFMWMRMRLWEALSLQLTESLVALLRYLYMRQLKRMNSILCSELYHLYAQDCHKTCTYKTWELWGLLNKFGKKLSSGFKSFKIMDIFCKKNGFWKYAISKICSSIKKNRGLWTVWSIESRLTHAG